MKESSIEIGKRIREKRESLGLTREQLCNSVDISPHFLSEIERGKKGASADTIIKLCQGLLVSADYLLLGREQTADISNYIESIKSIDAEYIPLAEEHLKTLIKTISVSKNINLHSNKRAIKTACFNNEKN